MSLDRRLFETLKLSVNVGGETIVGATKTEQTRCTFSFVCNSTCSTLFGAAVSGCAGILRQVIVYIDELIYGLLMWRNHLMCTKFLLYFTAFMIKISRSDSLEVLVIK